MLSQVDEITGYTSAAPNRVLKTLDTLVHPGQIHWAVVLITALTIGLIVLLECTPLGALGMVVAIAPVACTDISTVLVDSAPTTVPTR